ncbi:MAG: hypothetical protein AAB724_02185, partial [Patescibacteria group bacterium]
GIILITRPTILASRAGFSDPPDPLMSEIWNTQAKFSAKADGKDKIEITVILRNKKVGVPNKTVELRFLPQGPRAEKNFLNSDEKGAAVFQVVAENAGRYKAWAVVEGVAMAKSLTIDFQ